MIDNLIKKQHKHFGISYDGPSRHLPPEEENFRLAAMMEELSEFILAKSLEDKYDALIDLIVFASGTLERMGLPIEPAMLEVVEANTEKLLGPNTKRGGFSIDLIKPEGWEPANVAQFIRS
jgi:predicted HAD superfamily Cof-like phosphohydrolase